MSVCILQFLAFVVGNQSWSFGYEVFNLDASAPPSQKF